MIIDTYMNTVNYEAFNLVFLQPFLAGMPPSLTSELEPDNPFLAGHKLPVAAKKGLGY